VSHRFYAEVPLRELAQIRKTLRKAAEWGWYRCQDCGTYAFGPDPDPHGSGCRVKAALDILDRHLAPQALKPKLVKSLKQAGGKR
jgi:hypothetical protein